VSRDISVGIATRGPKTESRWGQDFPQPSRPALGSTQPPNTMGTGSFPGVNRRGRGVEHPPHLASKLKKELSYNSTLRLCLRDQFFGEISVYVMPRKLKIR
jgi:hypothetical protein